MIDWTWLAATEAEPLMILFSGIGIYLALLLFTRLAGLRSFSKMSSFDFAITVAFGSVIASTLMAKTPPLVDGVTALAVLYGLQYLVSRARRRSFAVERLVDNQPLLLMAGEEILSHHLDAARMTVDDLRSKLRLHGITHRSQVRAAVFEPTGDVSILKKDDELEPWLLDGVRGAEDAWPPPAGTADRGR